MRSLQRGHVPTTIPPWIRQSACGGLIADLGLYQWIAEALDGRRVPLLSHRLPPESRGHRVRGRHRGRLPRYLPQGAGASPDHSPPPHRLDRRPGRGRRRADRALPAGSAPPRRDHGLCGARLPDRRELRSGRGAGRLPRALSLHGGSSEPRLKSHTAPGDPGPCVGSVDRDCLLQGRERSRRLVLGRLHVAGLARRLGFLHQTADLADVGTGGLRTGQRPRRLDILTARSLDILTTRSLDILTARSLDILTARSLDILTTRGLDILTTRGLDILTTRGLDILTARSLHILTTRGLDILATRSLDILTTRGLDILTARSLDI